MNKKQKITTWIAIAIFLLTLTAAPWTVSPTPRMGGNIVTGERYQIPRSSYPTTAPIWDGPYGGQMDVGILLLEWVAIVVVYGAIFVLFKAKPKASDIKFGQN